ncbi:STAS/SEC14 domain-containing protein [Peribacillus deserti]|uniref:STAS/SEC14 domain-containing protein n=1 Tax=Peribacillus deserti TaxID=673318 RepID=A0A2N5M2A2_9BACI|nr:STAS/SEC14 domain-containing protein [Peribacillus deserti]PLT28445.1 STAS/SEC14 domain-containing protein [Peribacillus deserti]
MLTFLQSKDEFTIAVEFDGKATEEDAKKLDQFVEQRYSEQTHFNILAVMHGVEGSTLRGLVHGLKFDAKRWKQFNKFAVISEKNWLKNAAELGNILPGIKSEHFNKNQIEEAWDWVMK